MEGGLFNSRNSAGSGLGLLSNDNVTTQKKNQCLFIYGSNTKYSRAEILYSSQGVVNDTVYDTLVIENLSDSVIPITVHYGKIDGLLLDNVISFVSVA